MFTPGQVALYSYTAAAPAARKLKVWDGSQWVASVKTWDGSQWVYAKFWNGSSWVE